MIKSMDKNRRKNNKHSTILQEEKGMVSLIVTLVILSFLLFIGLFVASLNVKEMKVVLNINKSKKSFYAAESGMERISYAMYVEEVAVSSGFTLNDAYGDSDEYSFQVEAISDTEIKSIGGYGNIKRAVQMEY